MSSTPWRGTLIFAGTVAAVAAAATARFSGAQIEAASQDAVGAAQSGAPTSAGTTSGQAAPAATSQAATPPGSSGTGGSGATSSGTVPSDPASTVAAPSATPAAPQDVTIVGSTVQTRYGPLQLSVTFAGADITGVEALQAPSWHGESVQINAYAIPILNREAVAADSTGIDAVSGATVTSGAYVQSLQSAIDQHG